MRVPEILPFKGASPQDNQWEDVYDQLDLCIQGVKNPYIRERFMGQLVTLMPFAEQAGGKFYAAFSILDHDARMGNNRNLKQDLLVLRGMDPSLNNTQMTAAYKKALSVYQQEISPDATSKMIVEGVSEAFLAILSLPNIPAAVLNGFSSQEYGDAYVNYVTSPTADNGRVLQVSIQKILDAL